MNQVLRFNKVIKGIIILGDLCILNAIFVLLYHYFDYQTVGYTFKDSLPELLVLLNLVYLLFNYANGVILHERIVRPERIVRRAFGNTIIHAILFISLSSLLGIGTTSSRFYLALYCIFLVCLTTYRLTFRYAIKEYRRHGGNLRHVVFVGSSKNMEELSTQMTGDPTTGFRIEGYFDDTPSMFFPKEIPYLGKLSELIPYLEGHAVQQLYFSASDGNEKGIQDVVNYCDNHLIRFFSVPNVHNHLLHRMHLEMFGNVPVISIREEPLSRIENRLIKRTFDLFFSTLFLCTLFPIIFIIVGIAIKISSPGPILFKQKRSGENGKVFWCYKFRSMRVNAESDSLQATKGDPRTTCVGEFIRRTSIDETPQFINVFLGQMSVVGPRPHMLKHTEEYSKLINKFMVRHLIKPGITGWAQVTGFRGETKELWQMEGRVQRDVWYLEHWSFLLDMYIIYKTIKNAFSDINAY